MALEVVAAFIVAIVALWLVLQPLIEPALPRPIPEEPLDPEETPKGIALTALKEIEFDRETGKLSDADYELLKARYTDEALSALRGEQAGGVSEDLEALIAAEVRALRSASAVVPSNTLALACITCGPRPEADAVFCSSCGHRLAHPAPRPAALDRAPPASSA